ncbi:FAD-binding protein [Prauserella sp. ASG 168]|uniref:FAD-binding protein n=1 Tax=Prauserella cavernicola TaxID=2800127 RepID=A0A934QLV7_9PSEU|nr:FAD-binding protein [Prauserella cavernicola]
MAALTAALPGGRWSTEPSVLAAHATDRSGLPAQGAPAVVVFAEEVDDVRLVLRLAHAHRTPVVVRGAGTGLAGAATATGGEIVLSTARLNRILELSAPDQLAVVQPGVITAELDSAAAEHGLRYAPDPASVAISTIGGNIATNAGGLRCAKYGVTRDSVLGLDVVLADGSLLRTGRRTVKGVAGYDLTGLFVGSEGTLGVVVAATLRLRPVPRSTATLSAHFATVADAAAASSALTAAGLQPAVAELLDGANLEAIDAAQGTALRERGAAWLLVQTDGTGAEAEAALAEDVLTPFARSVRRASDVAEAERLLEVRRLALPSLERRGRVLIEDIAVPRSLLAEAVDEIAAIGRRHDVRVATMAHAGDGNLHPIFGYDGPEVPDAVTRAADEVFRLALRLGGTLTGEHGVGLLKRQWLGDELGEESLALHRRLRTLFDPGGVLNPGKLWSD